MYAVAANSRHDGVAVGGSLGPVTQGYKYPVPCAARTTRRLPPLVVVGATVALSSPSPSLLSGLCSEQAPAAVSAGTGVQSASAPGGRVAARTETGRVGSGRDGIGLVPPAAEWVSVSGHLDRINRKHGDTVILNGM